MQQPGQTVKVSTSRGTGKKFTGAKKKQRNCGLGDKIIGAHLKQKRSAPDIEQRHTTDFLNEQTCVMKSVTDDNDLLNIVANTHLQGLEFKAIKEKNLKIQQEIEENQKKQTLELQSQKDKVPTQEEILEQNGIRIVNNNQKPSVTQIEKQNQFMLINQHMLRIPRRPTWTHQQSKQEIQDQELKSFYEWRSQLNELEQNRIVSVTPFEKNLDFWRQLWRVIEFSDIVFIVADARNPLLFYSRDLQVYIQETSMQQKRRKKSVLLLNKADLVPKSVRQQWSDYLKSKNIEHIFFSALREEAILQYVYEQNTMQQQNSQQSLATHVSLEDKVRSGEQKVDNKQVDDLDTSDSESADAAKQQSEIADINQQDVAKPIAKDETDTQKTATTTAQSQFMQDMMHRQVKREKRAVRKQQILERQKTKNIKDAKSRLPNVTLQRDDVDIQVDLKASKMFSAKIFTRQELLQYIDYQKTEFRNAEQTKIEQKQNGKQQVHAHHITIGIVGFPNIGKSSIINCLAVETGLRTAISESPGKTKHFQTIQLNPQVQLCDCPGLIFPSFAHCRADFVLNGILPVDKERDYVGYLKLLCSRIPARVFNKNYQLEIKEREKFETGVGMIFGQKKIEGEFFCSYDQLLDEFFNKHGIERGMVGRRLVRDLFKGNLLWISLPPKQIKKISRISDVEYKKRIEEKKQLDKQLQEEEDLKDQEKVDNKEKVVIQQIQTKQVIADEKQAIDNVDVEKLDCEQMEECEENEEQEEKEEKAGEEIANREKEK